MYLQILPFRGGGITQSDLDKYLPLTGGTLSGALKINDTTKYEGSRLGAFITGHNNGDSAMKRTLYIYNPETKEDLRNALQLQDEELNFYNIYGEHNKDLIAESFLPLTGGTLSGDIMVEQSTYPTVQLSETTSGSIGWIQNNGLSMSMIQRDIVDDNTNERSLSVHHATSKSALDSAVQLGNRVDGTYTYYDIFGAHNMTNALKKMFPSTATPTYIPVFGSGWNSRGYTTPASLLSTMSGAKIQTGTYTGTAKYGSSNKNTLTFNFAPKVVIIVKNGSSLVPGNIFVAGQTQSCGIGSQTTSLAIDITIAWSNSNKTITWYAGDDDEQLNESGTYRWVAIG